MVLKTLPVFHLFAQASRAPAHLLGMRGVVPKGRSADLFFELSKLRFFGGQVKDAPLIGAVYPPQSVSDRVDLALEIPFHY